MTSAVFDAYVSYSDGLTALGDPLTELYKYIVRRHELSIQRSLCPEFIEYYTLLTRGLWTFQRVNGTSEC